MTTTDYILDIALILIVLRQMRERRIDLQTLVLPVVLVGIAAAQFLRSIPTAGNDVELMALLIVVGGALGSMSALATHMRPDGAGNALARAGMIAAGLWIVGMGGRMAFEYAASHGSADSITRFSVDHQISSSAAWTAALVFMAIAEVVSRLAILQLRAARIRRTGRPALAVA